MTAPSFFRITSSFIVHVPFVTVHFSVTLVLEVKPVTVDTFEPGVVMTAPFVAPTIVHMPEAVAGDGAFAAKVKLPTLHFV